MGTQYPYTNIAYDFFFRNETHNFVYKSGISSSQTCVLFFKKVIHNDINKLMARFYPHLKQLQVIDFNNIK